MISVPILSFTASYLVAFILEVTRIFFRSGIRSVVMLGFAMLVADAVLFALGFAWLVVALSTLKGVSPTAVLGGAFDGAIKPFVIWDILKMVFAALSVTGIWTLSKRRA